MLLVALIMLNGAYLTMSLDEEHSMRVDFNEMEFGNA